MKLNSISSFQRNQKPFLNDEWEKGLGSLKNYHHADAIDIVSETINNILETMESIVQVHQIRKGTCC